MGNQQAELPYEISPDYQRINQRNLLFARLDWDDGVKGLYEGLGPMPRSLERIAEGAEGYGLADYALLGAGRYLDGFNDMLSSATGGDFDLYSDASRSTRGWTMAHESWLDDPRLERARCRLREEKGPEALTQMVKKAARFLGADLVGVAPYDERWVYSHLYRRRDPADEKRWLNSRRSRPHDFPPGEEGQVIPFDMPQAKSVVVLAFKESYEALNTSPAIVGAAATGLAYSQMAFTTASLSEFIRALGHWARAAGNELALSIPFAVAAGLGELGRHGQLVSREYGPGIRLSKIFTDAELIPDGPRTFGVWEYCKVCKKCAITCPPRAIPFDDEPRWEGPAASSTSGVLKWHVNAELCSRYLKWNGGDCTNCQSRCPYNKDYSRWYHRVARDIAPKLGKGFASFTLWLDDILGYGRQASSDEWWEAEA
jgi:reductive dehalogenase